MKLFYLLAFLIVLTFSSLFAQTTTNKPHIIRTVPAFGDCNVDPNLKEIVFEFDQDMMPSWSFMDCPNPIPLVGEMVWKTKRILSLAVTLGPNRLYQSVMNSNWYRNFANEQGIPLDQNYFLFRTKTTIHPTQVDTVLNRNNYEKFCKYFLTNYAFKDAHGINWKKQLDSIKGGIVKSESESEFGVRLLQIIRKANDPNLSLGFSNQLFNSADFRLVPQAYNFDAIFNELTDIQHSKNFAVYSGQLGTAGYVLIQNLQQNWTEDIAFAVQKIKEMKASPYLILDLRLEYGGDESPAKAIVSTLLSNAITYEKTAVFNETTNLFDNMVTQTLSPSAATTRYNGKIIVIVSGNVMGSAESMVLMLKQISNVQIIGSKTYGSSSNPKTFQISTSVSANIPSWQAYDMKDNPIEGKGIEPDVLVEFPEADFIAEDPIIEYVKNLINNTGAILPLETGGLDFRVFPNPVKDIANISWTTNAAGKVDVQLIDSNGKIVYNQSEAALPVVNNSLNLNFSTYHLQAGLYLIKLTINNKTRIGKMVYQP